MQKVCRLVTLTSPVAEERLVEQLATLSMVARWVEAAAVER
jgi:hypothetical protein